MLSVLRARSCSSTSCSDHLRTQSPATAGSCNSSARLSCLFQQEAGALLLMPPHAYVMLSANGIGSDTLYSPWNQPHPEPSPTLLLTLSRAAGTICYCALAPPCGKRVCPIVHSLSSDCQTRPSLSTVAVYLPSLSCPRQGLVLDLAAFFSFSCPV